jgi:hypothetical protein
MTVKQLRSTTATHIDIVIVYGDKNEITIDAENQTAIEAFGTFVIDVLSIRDDETIAATLKMQVVRE